jgi:hypothetical protein
MGQTRTSPTSRRDALGPLVVSEKNPRYFSVAGDAGGPAVYLAGSHIWHNLQDGIGPGEPAATTPRGWTSASTSTSSRNTGTTSSACGDGSSSGHTQPRPTTTCAWSPSRGRGPDIPASGWFADPPAGDGRKVVIADTDHFAPR